MTWLAPKLKERIQIQEATNDPNALTGGFSQTYTTIATIWAGVRPVSMSASTAAFIRGEQMADMETHIFTVRKVAVESLGLAFTKAFTGAYDSIEDLNPLKSNWFIFRQRGSTTKGQLFRIHRIMDVGENDEYLEIRAEEIEEKGTGYAE